MNQMNSNYTNNSIDAMSCKSLSNLSNPLEIATECDNTLNIKKSSISSIKPSTSTNHSYNNSPVDNNNHIASLFHQITNVNQHQNGHAEFSGNKLNDLFTMRQESSQLQANSFITSHQNMNQIQNYQAASDFYSNQYHASFNNSNMFYPFNSTSNNTGPNTFVYSNTYTGNYPHHHHHHHPNQVPASVKGTNDNFNLNLQSTSPSSTNSSLSSTSSISSSSSNNNINNNNSNQYLGSSQISIEQFQDLKNQKNEYLNFNQIDQQASRLLINQSIAYNHTINNLEPILGTKSIVTNNIQLQPQRTSSSSSSISSSSSNSYKKNKTTEFNNKNNTQLSTREFGADVKNESFEESNENVCNNGSSKKKPVIYAWMKKVHLNNSSKLLFIELFQL